MPTVVFSDRDGTIVKDENYFLGVSPDWKDQVEFLPGVGMGIALINEIPDSYFFIATNQSGVALTGTDPRTGINFDNLTLDRVDEVNDFIVKEFAEEGACVNGCSVCPFVNRAYVEKSKGRGRMVNSEFVYDNHPDKKPNAGMIIKALNLVELSLANCDLYVIGDRFSDIQLALNIGATGILVEGSKIGEGGDAERVCQFSQFGKTIFIVDNFWKASLLIYLKKTLNNYTKKDILGLIERIYQNK